MTSNVSGVTIVHRMKAYLLVLPATGSNAFSVYKAWLTRLETVMGDAEAATLEAARLFPLIVSWELFENDEEMTTFEDEATGVDTSGILTLASGEGFNPPVSNEEMRRWQFKATSVGAGTVKLAIFLNNKKVSWGSE